MIRPSIALCAAIVVVVGYAMFDVKYEVMQQETALARIAKKIAENREAVRVLNAEWSLLTQPTRLEQLQHRYLGLAPIGTAQLGAIAAIPLRTPETQAPPPAPPPAVPAPLVAPMAAPLPHPPSAVAAKAQLATFKPSAAR